MRKFTLGALAVTFLVPAPLRGQQRFDPREVQAAAQLVPQIESDLRDYVTAQETFFVDNMRYAGSIRSLERSENRFRPSAGVTVVVLTANETGHNAIAVHEDLPSYVCAIRVGSAPAPLNDDAGDGDVTCRGPE
jgi:hypothetical protein